jgi:hypothetical protein
MHRSKHSGTSFHGLVAQTGDLLHCFFLNSVRADQASDFATEELAHDRLAFLLACTHRLRHPDPLSGQERDLLGTLAAGMMVFPDYRAGGYLFCLLPRAALGQDPIRTGFHRDSSLAAAAFLYQAVLQLGLPESPVADVLCPILNQLGTNDFEIPFEECLRPIAVVDRGAYFLSGMLDAFARDHRPDLKSFTMAAVEYVAGEARVGTALGKGPDDTPAGRIPECFSILGIALLSSLADGPVINHNQDFDTDRSRWPP